MNTTTKMLIIAVLSWSCWSCTTSNSHKDVVELTPGTPDVSADVLENVRFYIENSTHTNNVYNKTNYKAVWFDENHNLKPKAENLLEILKKAELYGLPKEQFHLIVLDSLVQQKNIQADPILTDNYLKFCTQIKAGRLYLKDTVYAINRIDSLDMNLVDVLFQNLKENSMTKELAELQPNHWEYKQLLTGFQRFVGAIKTDGERINIPNFKDDSTKCFAAVQKSLIVNGFFDSTYFVNHDSLVSALKQFQTLHGLDQDGKPGRNTRQVLAMSNEDRYFQGVLALEKWRTKKSYPEKYIRVNIPSYKLQLWEKDTLQKVHRVVVGARATPTPEFSAEMKKIVAYPFWHVPYSISSTELYYKAKKDSTYLRRNGYTVLNDGNSINSSSIDWSKVNPNRFPYKIRQNGGNGNSLGVVKFLFPNEHSVYLHDTPSKRLFKNDVRAYSHGCVRLHQPVDFAKFLLNRDQNDIPGDTLDSLIARRQQKHIYLKKKIPVYIEYISATADSSANLILHVDVYGRDKKAVNYMKSEFKHWVN